MTDQGLPLVVFVLRRRQMNFRLNVRAALDRGRQVMGLRVKLRTLLGQIKVQI